MQLVLKSQHCNLETCAIGRDVICVVLMQEICPTLSLVDVFLETRRGGFKIVVKWFIL